MNILGDTVNSALNGLSPYMEGLRDCVPAVREGAGGSSLFARVVETGYNVSARYPVIATLAVKGMYLLLRHAVLDVHLMFNDGNDVSDVTGLRRMSGLEFAMAQNRILFEDGSGVIVVQGLSSRNCYHGGETKFIELSSYVYENSSVAGLGIVAHEFAHAYFKSEGSFLVDLCSYSLSMHVHIISDFLGDLTLIIPMMLINESSSGAYCGERVRMAVLIFYWTFAMLASIPTVCEEAYANVRGYNQLNENFELSLREQAVAMASLFSAWMTYVLVFGYAVAKAKIYQQAYRELSRG